MRLHLAPLTVLLALACGDGRAEVAASSAQHARSAQRTEAAAKASGNADAKQVPFQAPDGDGWGRAGDLAYLERVLGGGDAKSPLPMLIMIHGLGDRPRFDWFGGAESIDTPVRLIMPQAPTPYYDGFAWFPFRAGGNDPHALGRGIADAADRLARAISVLRERRPTVGRPIIAGFSQGGMLSYALALRSPELCELSHPIAGMLPEPLWPKTKRQGVRFPRIAAMHGDADELVEIEPTRRLTGHLRELGHDVELREYPGVGHSITAAMEAHSVELLNAAARGIAPR
jgi:phospholipase/carboxylesterase